MSNTLNRILAIVCIAAFGLISSSCTGDSHSAGKLFHKNTIAPAFIENYSVLDINNINDFLEEWKEWSFRVSESLEYNTLDKKVSRGLAHYEWSKTNTRYLTLPISVPVYVWRKQINEFTPKVNTEKPVLYVTPEIENLISPFLGGVGENESDYYCDGKLLVNEDNITQLAQYISIQYGHWGGYWHLETMPIPEYVGLKVGGIELGVMAGFNYEELIAIPNNEQQAIEVISEIQI